MQILEQLRHLRGAPSVEMNEVRDPHCRSIPEFVDAQVPPDLVQSVLVENDDPDVRMSGITH